MSAPIAIDLFGGIGGVAIGMLRAGFHVVSIDVEPLCADVLYRNLAGPGKIFSSASNIVCRTADLLQASPLELLSDLRIHPSEVAWIHGSPECKDHSPAGKRNPAGPGHDALLVVPRWAAVCPNAHVTLENVPRVQISHRYDEMLSLLSSVRDVREYIVRAQWYGLPQSRQRLWVCAGPVGRPCIPVPPPTCDLREIRTWEWAMSNPCHIDEVDHGWCEKPTDWQSTILAWVAEGKSSAKISESPMREWIEQMYPDPGQRNFIRRLHRHRVVPAVLTGVKMQRMLIHCHPWLDRPSTVRECARFQGFPDEFQFPRELLSLTLAHRGIGNAVPIPMAEAFVREIMCAIRNGYKMSDGEILPSSQRNKNYCDLGSSAPKCLNIPLILDCK